MKDDDRRKCYYCRETGHARSQSRTRLKNLIDAEGKPVTAKSRSSSTAAVAPLADDHATTFLVTVPHVKRKIITCMCQDGVNDEGDAGSTAPTGSERVKLISAISTCETCLMTDTCAAEVSKRIGSTAVATTQFVTALDDSAHGNMYG